MAARLMKKPSPMKVWTSYRRSRGAPGTPTASIPATRMGGTKRETDRNRHGVRRGKRKDPLFASHS
jgi:hypothetical protein